MFSKWKSPQAQPIQEEPTVSPDRAGKAQGSYQTEWIQAMAGGTLTGKVYSKRTIDDYRHYVDGFFKRHSGLSAENLKKELMAIPAAMFAKREKCYKALLCFSKLLIQEEALEPGFMEEIKLLFPKRHLPPKRVTVDQTGLDGLLAVCETVQELDCPATGSHWLEGFGSLCLGLQM